MDDRKLVILALNINFDSNSKYESEEILLNANYQLNKRFSNINGYNIQVVCLPVKDQETTMYCVYSDGIPPENITENLKNFTKELDKLQKTGFGSKYLKKISKILRLLKMVSLFK